jgi:hypothetical protein
MGRIHIKKRSDIHIPQRSKINDFGDLFDFFSIMAYQRFMIGMKKLTKSSKNFSIHPLQYTVEVPFLVHSNRALNEIENQLYDSISGNVEGSCIENDCGMMYTPDIENITAVIIALYSYISFESLKKFQEEWPIEMTDKDFQEIKNEILDSTQHLVHDYRRAYTSKIITEQWRNQKRDSILDKPVIPVDYRIHFRCTDCRQEIYDYSVTDLNKVRCRKCNPIGRGPHGKIERIMPSRKHRRESIEPKIVNYEKNFFRFSNTFLHIRENIIAVTEHWEKYYLNCFEECKAKILKDFQGPARYSLAIRHYNADKKYNSDHNLNDDIQILKIVIKDEKYLALLTDIVEGNVISQDDISENFVSAANILLTLKFPYHLIKQKLIKDLKAIGIRYDLVRIGNEVTNLTAEYKEILAADAPSTLEIKLLEKKLDQHIEGLRSLRDLYLNL